MDNQVKKRISVLCLMGWMGLIFWFSAQPADKSGDMSMHVGRFVGRLVVSDYAELSKGKQDAFAEKIEYGVRKVAHASEYAVLGVLIFWTSSTWGRSEKKHAYFAALYGALYAITDEFHQLFVPGRAGRLMDVLIDTTGVVIGVLCVYTVYCYARRSRKHLV